MTAELVLVALGPAILVGSLVWRLSARLTLMDAKLDRLENENRHLRAELHAVQGLMRLLVDKGTIE